MKKLTLLFLAAFASFSTTLAQEDFEDSGYDTYYYEYSSLKFGESATPEGELIGESNTFTKKSGVLELTALLEMSEPLLLTLLHMEIYSGEELITSRNFDIPSKEWNYVTIPIDIEKPGTYFVDLYNQEETFITSESFTVY